MNLVQNSICQDSGESFSSKSCFDFSKLIHFKLCETNVYQTFNVPAMLFRIEKLIGGLGGDSAVF
jgi:hypothetical protein